MPECDKHGGDVAVSLRRPELWMDRILEPLWIVEKWEAR